MWEAEAHVGGGVCLPEVTEGKGLTCCSPAPHAGFCLWVPEGTQPGEGGRKPVFAHSSCPLHFPMRGQWHWGQLDSGEGIPRLRGDRKQRLALPSVGGGMAPITPGLTGSSVNWGHDSGVLGLL